MRVIVTVSVTERSDQLVHRSPFSTTVASERQWPCSCCVVDGPTFLGAAMTTSSMPTSAFSQS